MSSDSASVDVAANLRAVENRIAAAYDAADPSRRAFRPPRLIAVSKTKPVESVIAAYSAGQRHFGENYVQELCEKAEDVELNAACPDIRWHFIGNCQSNKAARLAKCPHLSCVETLTSAKLADKLNNRDDPIEVMIQVNTSGEANKNGVEPGEQVITLAKHVVEKCPQLQLVGLMTIGALARSLRIESDPESGENPDFICLLESRRRVCDALSWPLNHLGLSMGMSNDFEEAIRTGSTSVRVGSSIL